jgi:hypothetical protein
MYEAAYRDKRASTMRFWRKRMGQKQKNNNTTLIVERVV